jgi:uncharacterized protein
MRIVVSEIPDEGLDVELKETPPSQEVRYAGPVHARLRIERKGSEVMVSGDVRSDVALECSRCLKPYVVRGSAPVSVVYRPAEGLSREEHYELKGDELETGFYRGDILDTDDILTEQVLLNLPMKPLCSQDCKGICPKCGIDRNVETCHCDLAERDPRFDKLKELLKRKE